MSKFTPGRQRSIIILLWVLFGAVIVGLGFFFVLVYNGVVGYMPPSKT